MRNDVPLIDFQKAGFFLNETYRQLQAQSETTDTEAAPPNHKPQSSKDATPKKSNKIDDSYERKPSPINLKPLSPKSNQQKPDVIRSEDQAE